MPDDRFHVLRGFLVYHTFAAAYGQHQEMLRLVDSLQWSLNNQTNIINKRNVTIREQKKEITGLKGQVTTLKRALSGREGVEEEEAL